MMSIKPHKQSFKPSDLSKGNSGGTEDRPAVTATDYQCLEEGCKESAVTFWPMIGDNIRPAPLCMPHAEEKHLALMKFLQIITPDGSKDPLTKLEDIKDGDDAGSKNKTYDH